MHASADNTGIDVGAASTDATFRQDLATLIAYKPTADHMGVGSTRYSVNWPEGDDPPVKLFDAVVADAPDATRLQVGNYPALGPEDLATISWPAASDPDAYLEQMHAVTDSWAQQTTPTRLYLDLDSTLTVSLPNNECPTLDDPDLPRNEEFWEYATTDGRSITLAPDNC